MMIILIKTKTFEGNPLPIGGDNAGLLENVGGGATDLVPVPGQVLDGHRYDDDQGKDSNNDVDEDGVLIILIVMVMMMLRIWFHSRVRSLMVIVMTMIRTMIVVAN